MDPHEELLRDVDLEELEKEVPKWRKPLIIILAVFLVGLMVSFVFVMYPIGHIIQGQLASKPLRENRIDLDEFSIIFDDALATSLREMFLAERKVEFSVCLGGKKQNNTYRIASLYLPEQLQASYNQVTFEPCAQDTLLILHTHPYKSCIASRQDLRMLERSQAANPDALMVVMCEPARFSVYS